MTVEKGDNVKIEYEGKLDSGEIFDSTTHGDHTHPIEFEVGSGKVIPGFENAVIGMEKDQEKEFSLESGEAYGDVREELKKQIPRSSLPQDQEPKEGMTLVAKTPEGQQFPAKIIAVDENNVTLDLNHPLAGKKLNFKIKVVDINKKSGETQPEKDIEKKE